MIRTIVGVTVSVLLCGSAVAQPLTAEQCQFNSRALTIYQQQRERALDDVVNARTRLTIVDDEVTALRIRVRDLEAQITAMTPKSED